MPTTCDLQPSLIDTYQKILRSLTEKLQRQPPIFRQSCKGFVNVSVTVYNAKLDEKMALRFLSYKQTKSQAVARIADRTASQHLWASRDVISHVTI